MRASRFLAAVLFLSIGSLASAAWVETNNDGGPGQLDHETDWVAAYNGSTPKPATSWSKADVPPASNFGIDPGWVDNVIQIADADATAFAAANHVETFDKVRVTVSCTTSDLDEEFGVMAHMSYFGPDSPITVVSGYAATFSANNADEVGELLKLSIYKIVNGGVLASEVIFPELLAMPDDFIFAVELTVADNTITARLYEDRGDAIPMAEAEMIDTSPLPAGYSGVLSLDVASANGISAFYDTLVSEIPEPGMLTLLIAGLAAGLLPLRRSKVC
ncbi:MAG: hypothetical protein JW888_16475 [Pirellulales bacterium]|nr:hypothetical protein [Pirellulales bacterium]